MLEKCEFRAEGALLIANIARNHFIYWHSYINVSLLSRLCRIHDSQRRRLCPSNYIIHPLPAANYTRD